MNDFMNSEFNIEDIVLACYVPEGKGMTVHRKRKSHGLALHTGGVKKYVFENGKEYIVHENDIIYLPKYSTYEVTALQNGDCYAINFEISKERVSRPFVFGVRNSILMREYFKSAKNVWESKKFGYTLKCKAELYNIIYNMRQEFFSYVPKGKIYIIRPAIDYIHENYTDGLLRIAELADMCSITPEYFRSIFKSFYGVSPKSYINGLKIARAKELLASGMYSVTEAAVMSGYTDMSHFSREFKKVVGITPKNYCGENTSLLRVKRSDR